MIPATIYGLGEAPVSIAISPKVVARVLATDTGMNTMLHLQREGTDIKRHVIIKDLQRDPVNGRLVHVDFMRVDPTHKVRVHVPIVLHGTPLGVKEGGLRTFFVVPSGAGLVRLEACEGTATASANVELGHPAAKVELSASPGAGTEASTELASVRSGQSPSACMSWKLSSLLMSTTLRPSRPR